MMVMAKVIAIKRWIKCFTFEKEERENKNRLKAKVY
jgi:hypothetical protein